MHYTLLYLLSHIALGYLNSIDIPSNISIIIVKAEQFIEMFTSGICSKTTGPRKLAFKNELHALKLIKNDISQLIIGLLV